MNANDKKTIIRLYKEAYPNVDRKDSGYILPDGTIIDISSKGEPYCHGREFITETSLAEWRVPRKDLPSSNRMTADFIMNEIGGIEFTIDNAHIQCVRLPNKPLTAEQHAPLLEVLGAILERGLVRVEVLGTSEYKEYYASSNTANMALTKIIAYYTDGSLAE